jgi:hypothetical protein
LPERPDCLRNILESDEANSPIEIKEGKITMAAYSRQEVTAVKMQILAGVALASLLALSAVPTAHADEFDQATRITFSAPVRVPGQVLPAGGYWFVLLDHGAYPAVVQIFNADRSALIETIETGYAERLAPTGKTVFSFAEPDTRANPDADIPALTEWFYPGRDIGHEFIYSGRREQHLKHQREILVPVGGSGAAVPGD